MIICTIAEYEWYILRQDGLNKFFRVVSLCCSNIHKTWNLAACHTFACVMLISTHHKSSVYRRTYFNKTPSPSYSWPLWNIWIRGIFMGLLITWALHSCTKTNKSCDKNNYMTTLAGLPNLINDEQFQRVNWGFGHIWINQNCYINLLESISGEAMANNLPELISGVATVAGIWDVSASKRQAWQ